MPRTEKLDEHANRFRTYNLEELDGTDTWVEIRDRCARISIVCEVFHRTWCNLSLVPKSYVKEGLQRTPNVLPSGPFKKVSERPTE
jgi:hypothetical protein